MVYRFTLISDEVDDFIREIKIDSEATFHDFHEAILKAAGSVMTTGKKNRKSHWKIWVPARMKTVTS